MILHLFLILLMLFIGIWPMVREIRLKKFDFFNLKNPFIIYFLLQLGVSGFTSIYTGNISSIGLEYAGNEKYYTYALLISNLGILFFQIGYYKKSAMKFSYSLKTNLYFPRRKVNLFVIFAFVFGYLMFFLFLLYNGGLIVFLDNRETFRSGGISGQGIFVFSFTTLISIASQVYIIFLLKNKSTNLILLLLLLVATTFPAYLIGFRSLIILPLINFILIFNYTFQKIKPKVLLPIFLFVGTIFTIYGITRKIPPEFSISYEEMAKVILKEPDLLFAITNRSRGTEVLASVIKKLEATGEFTYGLDALIETLTIPIPRKIWTNKPQPNGEKFGNYFFSDELFLERGYMADAWGGISPTVVGEFYWYFGIIGVVFGLFCLGRLARHTYFLFISNQNDTTLLYYSNFYISFAMFTESFQGYLNGLFLVFLVLLPISFFLNYKIRLI